jgi:hypothetical protein
MDTCKPKMKENAWLDTDTKKETTLSLAQRSLAQRSVASKRSVKLLLKEALLRTVALNRCFKPLLQSVASKCCVRQNVDCQSIA